MNTTRNRFIVMTSSAKMPAKVRAEYRNVALVEVAADFEGTPAMISANARGVVRIVRHYGALNVGKTSKSAYARAFAEATAEAGRLNA